MLAPSVREGGGSKTLKNEEISLESEVLSHVSINGYLLASEGVSGKSGAGCCDEGFKYHWKCDHHVNMCLEKKRLK